MCIRDRPRLVPMIANVLRFLRLRPIPKMPRVIAIMAKKKARMLMIGSQEPRRARVPKMMAKIPKIFSSLCFICDFLDVYKRQPLHKGLLLVS